MKKLIAFLMIGMSLWGLKFLPQNKAVRILEMDGLVKACIVTDDDVQGENVIQTLDYNYIYLNNEEIKTFNQEINIKGITLYLENEKYKDIIKTLNMLVFKEEVLQDYSIIYGYTNKFRDFKIIDNKKINVQIVKNDDQVIIGFPLVLSGF